MNSIFSRINYFQPRF